MQAIQAASGFVVERRSDGSPRFRGTCFAYSQSHVILTAAHCVNGLSVEEIGVSLPVGDNYDDGLDVVDVICHPSADVAMIRIRRHELEPFYSFRGYDAAVDWGDRVVSFGFPEDTDPGSPVRPTPRMFSGIVQRFFEYNSPSGYKYIAGELSFPAPGGLSGGPVCRTQDQSTVVGVVAENRDALTYISQVDRVEERGEHFRSETHAVIRYAICVRICDIVEWLEEMATRSGA